MLLTNKLGTPRGLATQEVHDVQRSTQKTHDGISMKVFLALNARFPTSIPEHRLRISGANLSPSFCSVEAHPRKVNISAHKIFEKKILGSIVAVLHNIYVNFGGYYLE